MTFRLLPLSAVVAAFAAVGTIAGCPQPEASFDDFGERYEDTEPGTQSVTTGPVGDCTVPEVGGESDGLHVFALSAQLGPKRPLLLDANVAIQDDGAGGKQFSFSLIPLRTPYRTAADNENIDVLEPVGPPIELGPFPLAIDGTFTADLPKVQISGKANPFSSNDLEATISLTGQICTETDRPGVRLGFICGSLEGDVSAPVKLGLTPDKNSFTFTAYEGTRPEEYAIDCGGTLSEAFP